MKENSFVKILIGFNLILIVLVLKPDLSFGLGQVFKIDGLFSYNIANSNSQVNNGTKHQKICYVNLDSLEGKLLEMADVAAASEAKMKAVSKKAERKEDEIQRWQKSWGDLRVLLPSEQLQYQKEAILKEQEMSQFMNSLEMELTIFQRKETLRIRNKISAASAQFAKNNGYDIVLSYQLGESMFYGAEELDVSESIIKLMNEAYKN